MTDYSNNLYILPFDHRVSFIKSFLGNIKQLDKKQVKLIQEYKKYIFEGFLMALEYIKNPANCAILVDEEYGSQIIKAAQKKNIIVCLSADKSGQKMFGFEYGRNFDKHILDIQPEVVKALVRYNPTYNKTTEPQLKKLKELSHWCKTHDYNFLLELLVPATPAQLKRVHNKRELYDQKIRPDLTLKTIHDFYQVGIQPDIWKIEAFESRDDWAEIIDAIRDEDRTDVAIIMLGRGESFAKVKSWMNIAPKHLLNGFAVGRTVFLRSLLDLHNKKINQQQAIKEIAKNYLELVKYWQK